eukprot:scaffold68169_cov47-Prasinocladus_malaysianus.AAC.2
MKRNHNVATARCISIAAENIGRGDWEKLTYVIAGKVVLIHGQGHHVDGKDEQIAVLVHSGLDTAWAGGHQDGHELSVDADADRGVHMCQAGIEGHQAFVVP